MIGGSNGDVNSGVKMNAKKRASQKYWTNVQVAGKAFGSNNYWYQDRDQDLMSHRRSQLQVKSLENPIADEVLGFAFPPATLRDTEHLQRNQRMRGSWKPTLFVDDSYTFTDHKNSYGVMACTIQLSSQYEDFIIDTITIPIDIRTKLVLEDPSKLIVVCNTSNDIIWLQNQFRIFQCDVFDRPGLQVNQACDWTWRPIPSKMLKYCQGDTHFLIRIFNNIIKQVHVGVLQRALKNFKPNLVKVHSGEV
ncbi:unnamed protein product [Allacma fusca]|uniref:3'-5' exonuclease domain-containing protein n=1 Tax=Allacma fusca TaxID=39272 RepID=A0A8J2PAV9_9HEXA|nr:unnamed protein product [Allacma fusca]